MATRHTGTLKSWNDGRGFGFIRPTHGGSELFVHISALPRDGTRPTIGEKLTYELGRGKDGKPQAVQVQRLAVGDWSEPRRHASPRERRQPGPGGPGLGKRIIGLLLAGALAIYGVHQYQKRAIPEPDGVERIAEPDHQVTIPPSVVEPTASFHCDGRTHCSQMTSCTEAKLFLKNCPGVEMDGDHDGVPCEQQWCTSPMAK